MFLRCKIVATIGHSNMKSKTDKLLADYNKPTFPIREGWRLKYFFSIPFPPTTGNHQYYSQARIKTFNGSNFVFKNKSVAIGYKSSPYYKPKIQTRFALKESVKHYRQYIRYYLLPFVKEVGTLDGRLGYCMHIAPPDRRKRDEDNLKKIVFDALEHAGVVKDDSLLKRGRITQSEEPDKTDPTITFLIFKRGES